jgi:ferrous iron transport protein B
VILACSIILWALASFPGDKVADSYAGQIGRAMEPAIAPLGWSWEVGFGILASFAAREVFISALATVYNLESSDDQTSTLSAILAQKQASGEFTLAAALSLLVFYVCACQCMSTLAVCRRETGGWRWPTVMLLYMSVLAYGAAWATHEIAIASGL